MEKIITLKELVEKIIDANDDEQFELLNQIEVQEYIEYQQKIVRMENIIQATSMLDDKIHFTTPMIPVFFLVTIIDMYTNIKMDNDALFDFNLLKQTGLDEFFVSKEDGIIPYEEIEECNAILNMLKEDFVANNCSVYSYIGNELGKIKEQLNATFEPIVNTLAGMNKDELKNIIDSMKK